MWPTLNNLFGVPIGSRGEKMRGRIRKRGSVCVCVWRGGGRDGKTNERTMGVSSLGFWFKVFFYTMHLVLLILHQN